MTIEEQIEQAAREYATHWIDTKETDFYGKFIQEKGCNRDEERGFIAGARWVVANPKSPWISVDGDLPCNHEELLSKEKEGYTESVMAYTNIGVILISMRKYNNEWKWETSNYFPRIIITHWLPIPELPKE